MEFYSLAALIHFNGCTTSVLDYRATQKSSGCRMATKTATLQFLRQGAHVVAIWLSLGSHLSFVLLGFKFKKFYIYVIHFNLKFFRVLEIYHDFLKFKR